MTKDERMQDGSVQQWNWDAWRADEGVGLLGGVARCFWFEVLGVMWKSGQTGELSGSMRDLAKLSRVTETEARAAITEIKARNVADVVDSNGHVTLINRRMRRAHQDSLADESKNRWERELNAWRQENHRRKRRGDEPLPRPVTPIVTGEVTAIITEAVTGGGSPSPSSLPAPLSLSSPTPQPPRRGRESADRPGLFAALVGMPTVPESLRTEAFYTAWDEWARHRAERKPKLSPRAAAMQLRKLERIGPERAVAAIEHSIAGSFQGVYEDHQQQRQIKTTRGDQHGKPKPNAVDRGQFEQRSSGIRILGQNGQPAIAGGSGGHPAAVGGDRPPQSAETRT